VDHPAIDCRLCDYPTGKSLLFFRIVVQAPLRKNILLFRRPKHPYIHCHPVPLEGVSGIVRDAGGDAVDAAASGASEVAGRDQLRERSDGVLTNGALRTVTVVVGPDSLWVGVSPRRRSRPTGRGRAFNPRGDVTSKS